MEDTLQQTIEKASIAGRQASKYTGVAFNPLEPIDANQLSTENTPFNLTAEELDTSTTAELSRFSTQDFTQGLETKAVQAQAGEQESFESYLKAALATPGETELTVKAEEKAGVPELEAQVKEYNQQLKSEQEALRKQVEQIQTGAGTATAAQRNASAQEAQRVSLRKQADIAIIGMAAQGRFDSAKSIADRAVAVQMEQGQRRLDVLGLNYERNKDLFSKAEQRAFESAQSDRQRAQDEAKENKELIYQTGLTVGQNGGGTALMQQIFGAKTPEEAARIGANYLSNPLDRQLKNLQISKANLEYEQLESAQEVLSDPKWSTLVNQTASLVGSERGKAIRADMAGYIASGNYKAAWNEVSNAVEEKLTGENATKFGNQVTDYEAMIGLKDAIQAYSDGGGDMGLLVGKAEDISNRLAGVTGNPQLTALATQLSREFQTYRTNATGAAFSPEESREYAKVNPRTTASLDLNLAVIDGALNQLQNRIVSTTKTRVSGAEDLWKLSHGQTTEEYLNDVDTVLQDTSSPLNSWLNSFMAPTQ